MIDLRENKSRLVVTDNKLKDFNFPPVKVVDKPTNKVLTKDFPQWKEKLKSQGYSLAVFGASISTGAFIKSQVIMKVNLLRSLLRTPGLFKFWTCIWFYIENILSWDCYLSWLRISNTPLYFYFAVYGDWSNPCVVVIPQWLKALLWCKLCCSAEGCWFESSWMHIFFFILNFLLAPYFLTGSARTNEIKYNCSNIVHVYVILDVRQGLSI